MMNERTTLLLGAEKMAKIEQAKILLIGLGGVGGYAFEALVRSGFLHITICDFDVFEESNLNRQIYATQESLGFSKAHVAKKRALEINPKVEVETILKQIKKEDITSKFLKQFTFVIDACDDVEVKKSLFFNCAKEKIPFISCLGTANKTHPEELRIGKLKDTFNDPLAKKLRGYFKGSSVLNTNVVWSKEMPKKGRGTSLDPLKLPVKLQTALEALYMHYEKVFNLWKKDGLSVPPCFIIVCNNTSTSKLVYDYVSGFYRENEHGEKFLENGRLPLFRNFDDNGVPLARPKTLLIDSQQLEASDVLDDNFAEAAKDEIARFKREIRQRGGALAAELQRGGQLSEATILREVMNTVGKSGQLGETIRCVVSVSMLTEGWDANTVTHVLGVRAFGTQLLCEQVIGRALRRQSYELNDEGLFNVEYSDILGIPFDFTAKPVIAKPVPPRETIQVKAVRPERDELEITFPRVIGYRRELPEEVLTASFNEDSRFELTPDLVGATITQNSGIIGQSENLVPERGDIRKNTILMHLTKHLLMEKFRDAGNEPKLYLFGQLKRIAQEWFDNYFSCTGGTKPSQLLYKYLAEIACNRIKLAITRTVSTNKPVKAILDSYNPQGSTRNVNFTTSKQGRWETDPR